MIVIKLTMTFNISKGVIKTRNYKHETESEIQMYNLCNYYRGNN